jgi:hypothetical protein
LVSVHISVVHTLHGDHEDFYLFWFCVVLELCHSLPLAVPLQIGCVIPDYVKFWFIFSCMLRILHNITCFTSHSWFGDWNLTLTLT